MRRYDELVAQQAAYVKAAQVRRRRRDCWRRRGCWRGVCVVTGDLAGGRRARGQAGRLGVALLVTRLSDYRFANVDLMGIPP